MKRICVLPGDGIGPEVIDPALKILLQIARPAGFELVLDRAAIGGEALDRFGTPLPQSTLDSCKASDAVLLGAVGGPKWDSHPPNLRPEKGLLGIRKGLGLYGNLRPVRQALSLLECSTLKAEVVRGVDLVVVRELTGGLYYGEPRGISGAAGSEVGVNTMVYHRAEIERIARRAFQLARQRRRKVTSVDKVHGDFPDVHLEHQYVDNCAMQMVLRPTQFDVLLTENTFGDILSDIGAVLTGSIGTLPSASVGDGPALYEPVHGSAPDIAGKNVANPMGAIGCVAMMFEISFGRPDLASSITRAVDRVLEQGLRTSDLANSRATIVGTREFVQSVQEQLDATLSTVQPS